MFWNKCTNHETVRFTAFYLTQLRVDMRNCTVNEKLSKQAAIRIMRPNPPAHTTNTDCTCSVKTFRYRTGFQEARTML